MRNSNSIKNLSIALEALSRIPDSYLLSHRIRELLEDQIKEEETAIQNPTPALNPVNPDDEIPF